MREVRLNHKIEKGKIVFDDGDEFYLEEKEFEKGVFKFFYAGKDVYKNKSIVFVDTGYSFIPKLVAHELIQFLPEKNTNAAESNEKLWGKIAALEKQNRKLKKALKSVL